MIRVQARIHGRVKEFLDNVASVIPMSTVDLVKRMTVVLNQGEISELKEEYGDEYDRLRVIAESGDVFTSYEKIVRAVWGDVRLRRSRPPVRLVPLNIVVDGGDEAGVDAMFYWTYVSFTKGKHISEAIMLSISEMVSFVNDLSNKIEAIKLLDDARG